MKTNEEYEAMAKKAAYLIVQAIRMFKDEPTSIQDQARGIVFSHMQRMMDGEKVTIEGPGLVTEIREAGPEDPINTSAGETPGS